MHQFIKTWKAFDITNAPYILQEDTAILKEKYWSQSYTSWKSYAQSPNFGKPDDNRFHFGLLPVPYSGNLSTASVFVLLLNPGFGPHDYFGEYEVPEYRKARINNLRQVKGVDFMDLNPFFSWHGGYRYWNKRLWELIQNFSEQNELEYDEARKFFATQIAAIELVPYHSTKFHIPDGVVKRLASVELARSYVKEILVPRAAQNDCLVVITRSSKHWGVSKQKNIVIYKRGQCRGANLSPRTKGGKEILKFLQRRFQKQRL